MSATPIPIFGDVDSVSNYGSLITVDSATQITVNFTGIVKLSCCLHVIGDDNRTQIDVQFFLNSLAIGPVSSGGFIFDSGRADEASPVIPAYTHPVTVGDTIDLRSSRIYDNGDVMFVDSGSSYIMVEVVVEPPTLMNASLSSTRTTYNALSSSVKSLLIDLLVVQSESSGNTYNQDVSAESSEDVDEYLDYLKKTGYGCTNNSYSTIDVSW